MPVYHVQVTLGDQVVDRLIEAPTEATALKHAAQKYLKAEAVRTAEQIKKMAELAAAGVKVETAEKAG